MTARSITPLLPILCALWACASQDSGDQPPADAMAPAAPTRALFELPRDGEPPASGFYALPFPNDLRIDPATGQMDLGDYVRANPLIDLYVESVQRDVRGFSVTAASFARFDGPIDVASLPATPADSQQPGASVYLVNIDPDSDRRGERVPLRFRFEPRAGNAIGANWLSALPFPGYVLAEQTTYALVITTRLRGANGAPVEPAPALAAVLAPEPPPGADAALLRARAVYAPLAAWLDPANSDPAGGPANQDRVADLVSAAVFTTQDATSLMGRIRQVVYEDVPEPTPRDITRPAPEGPNYAWIDGVYDSPGFQRGEPPFSRMSDGGDIAVDQGGRPEVQRMDALRFSLSVPRGDMPAAGWPVVLFAHGTGGSYHSFHNNRVAELLAAEGIAVISTDQVMHFPRIPAGASPEILFFNVQNPLSVRDNTLQGAADDFQLLRLVLGFDHTEPDGVRVAFDPGRIYFFGHSQGGLTGPPFLAHEPLVKGAVLSGAGGLIYLSLLYKTQPLDIAGLTISLLDEYPLDEFHPVLALLQTYLDRADPVVYGPLLVQRPVAGVTPKHIFQSEGFTDRYTPVPSIEALATSLGVDLVEPVLSPVAGLNLLGRTVRTAPVTGNQAGTTAVLLQYDEVPDSDGHFVLFRVDDARRQVAAFLRTLVDTGTATLPPP